MFFDFFGNIFMKLKCCLWKTYFCIVNILVRFEWYEEKNGKKVWQVPCKVLFLRLPELFVCFNSSAFSILFVFIRGLVKKKYSYRTCPLVPPPCFNGHMSAKMYFFYVYKYQFIKNGNRKFHSFFPHKKIMFLWANKGPPSPLSGYPLRMYVLLGRRLS